MKQDLIYKHIESTSKKMLLMEKHYGIDKIDPTEPYFTTSQETDIMEMISDGKSIDEIISQIQRW